MSSLSGGFGRGQGFATRRAGSRGTARRRRRWLRAGLLALLAVAMVTAQFGFGGVPQVHALPAAAEPERCRPRRKPRTRRSAR